MPKATVDPYRRPRNRKNESWEACRKEYPEMAEIKPGHEVRCLIYSGQVKVPDTVSEVSLHE